MCFEQMLNCHLQAMIQITFILFGRAQLLVSQPFLNENRTSSSLSVCQNQWLSALWAMDFHAHQKLKRLSSSVALSEKLSDASYYDLLYMTDQISIINLLHKWDKTIYAPHFSDQIF